VFYDYLKNFFIYKIFVKGKNSKRFLIQDIGRKGHCITSKSIMNDGIKQGLPKNIIIRLNRIVKRSEKVV
jgi:hypothetical protein